MSRGPGRASHPPKNPSRHPAVILLAASGPGRADAGAGSPVETGVPLQVCQLEGNGLGFPSTSSFWRGTAMALRTLVRHDAASHARYQALKQLARTQRRILEGAPGMLKRRTRRGTEYWVREFNGPGGRKTDEHLGTVADVGEARLREAQAEIDLAKALMAGASA